MPLYDQAIKIAPAAPLRDESVRVHSLTATEPSNVSGIDAWTAVDARVYRGVLRHLLGERAGAQSDLREAWKLSPPRVRGLLARYSLALRERPAEADALRAFWLGTAGELTDTTRRIAWAKETRRDLGLDAAQWLCEGIEWTPVAGLRVTAVESGGAAERAGLRCGDILSAVAAKSVPTAADLKAELQTARQGGLAEVSVSILRDDAPMEVRLSLEKLGLGVDEFEDREPRVKR